MKFGFEILNGKYIVNTIQAEIVKKAMCDYIKGVSLKTKAEELTAQGIEYSPGKSNWNKNRIQRMLKDESYIGKNNYPAIVDEELFNAVNSEMNFRNTQKNVDRYEVFSSSVVPICCSNCGAEVSRRYEGRTKTEKVYRICENPDCNKAYHISDLNLRIMIRDKLAVTEERTPNISDETSREIMRLNNEIERDLSSSQIDDKNIKNKILQWADLQYSQYAHPKGSIDYDTMNLCSFIFNREVKRRVKVVFLESDDKIWLLMKDGQVVGKDAINDECNI